MLCNVYLAILPFMFCVLFLFRSFVLWNIEISMEDKKDVDDNDRRVVAEYQT